MAHDLWILNDEINAAISACRSRFEVRLEQLKKRLEKDDIKALTRTIELDLTALLDGALMEVRASIANLLTPGLYNSAFREVDLQGLAMHGYLNDRDPFTDPGFDPAQRHCDTPHDQPTVKRTGTSNHPGYAHKPHEQDQTRCLRDGEAQNTARAKPGISRNNKSEWAAPKSTTTPERPNRGQHNFGIAANHSCNDAFRYRSATKKAEVDIPLGFSARTTKPQVASEPKPLPKHQYLDRSVSENDAGFTRVRSVAPQSVMAEQGRFAHLHQDHKSACCTRFLTPDGNVHSKTFPRPVTQDVYSREDTQHQQLRQTYRPGATEPQMYNAVPQHDFTHNYDVFGNSTRIIKEPDDEIDSLTFEFDPDTEIVPVKQLPDGELIFLPHADNLPDEQDLCDVDAAIKQVPFPRPTTIKAIAKSKSLSIKGAALAHSSIHSNLQKQELIDMQVYATEDLQVYWDEINRLKTKQERKAKESKITKQQERNTKISKIQKPKRACFQGNEISQLRRSSRIASRKQRGL